MADQPTFEDVTGDKDPTGEYRTRKVQSLGRVDVPDEYLENMGVEEGDKVAVVCGEDFVKIVKATTDNLL